MAFTGQMRHVVAGDLQPFRAKGTEGRQEHVGQVDPCEGFKPSQGFLPFCVTVKTNDILSSESLAGRIASARWRRLAGFRNAGEPTGHEQEVMAFSPGSMNRWGVHRTVTPATEFAWPSQDRCDGEKWQQP